MHSTRSLSARLIGNVEKVTVGKTESIRLISIGLLCQGHVLIEDVPGTGSTMVAKSLARSVGCTFNGIQFTPDMPPSDVTGVSIFNQENRESEYRPGPTMAQVVLTDEINRATPKTQEALLEAIEERQVTVDGVTRPTPGRFLVVATQNPIGYEGTFPFPETQLDRFMLRVNPGCPSPQDETRVMERQQLAHPVGSLQQVVSVGKLGRAQTAAREVKVSSE